MRKLYIIIPLIVLCTSCSSSKNYNNPEKIYAENNIQNIDTKDCSWLQRNVELNQKQIDSLKVVMSRNPSEVKIRTISSIPDTLKKYNIKKLCVVILQ